MKDQIKSIVLAEGAEVCGVSHVDRFADPMPSGRRSAILPRLSATAAALYARCVSEQY